MLHSWKLSGCWIHPTTRTTGGLIANYAAVRSSVSAPHEPTWPVIRHRSQVASFSQEKLQKPRSVACGPSDPDEEHSIRSNRQRTSITKQPVPPVFLSIHSCVRGTWEPRRRRGFSTNTRRRTQHLVYNGILPSVLVELSLGRAQSSSEFGGVLVMDPINLQIVYSIPSTPI